MFIDANGTIVNLQNVSNINVLKDKCRIIFNMNYNIEINLGKNKKLISDYVYWDCIDLQQLNGSILSLTNKYFVKHFIRNGNNGYININEISSIKFAKQKNRVIFNLSHPITFIDFDKQAKITSEFVYSNFNNQEDYLEYINYMQEVLKEKNYEY